LLSAQELRSYLESSHCILGIFGDSGKAGNVIPYKAHQPLASNRILITRSGPAFAELLNGGEEPGLSLVPPADPTALAAAILAVYTHYREICRVSNTRELYDRSLGSSVIHARIASALEVL